MKRGRTSSSSNQDQARKKHQIEASGVVSTDLGSQLKDIESPRDQAEPYRLTTAKFSISTLTPTWSVGRNRPIDKNHAKALCRMFMQNGIRRKKASDRLIVVCKKEDVEKMLAHIEGRQTSVGRASEDGEEKWPYFHDWEIVIGAKAELATGNHRVEALKEYMEKMKLGEGEGWWICDVYDKGECFFFLPLVQLQERLTLSAKIHYLMSYT